MAKRGGGFPGGMPGNMNNLMKQAQRMQRQMEESQKKLEEEQKQLEAKEFTATSGGAVSVTVMGDKTVKKIDIAPEAVDPDDVEMLQDMIITAVNDALRQVDEESAKLMEGAGGGLSSLMGGAGLGGASLGLPF